MDLTLRNYPIESTSIDKYVRRLSNFKSTLRETVRKLVLVTRGGRTIPLFRELPNDILLMIVRDFLPLPDSLALMYTCKAAYKSVGGIMVKLTMVELHRDVLVFKQRFDSDHRSLHLCALCLTYKLVGSEQCGHGAQMPTSQIQ
jgi:hypothetical protein